MEEEAFEISLVEIWSVIRNNLKMIFTITLLFGVVGLLVNLFLLPPTYTTCSRVYIMNTTLDTPEEIASGFTMDEGDLDTSLMLSKDYIEIINSDLVTKAAAKRMNLKDLKKYKISVSAPEDTRMIKIMVSGHDCEKTVKLNNILTEEFTNCVKNVIKMNNVTVIDHATTPDEPSGPAKGRNTILAALMGMILAMAVSFIRFFMDSTIKTNEDVEKTLGLPVLARVPKLDD